MIGISYILLIHLLNQWIMIVYITSPDKMMSTIVYDFIEK